MGLDRDEHPRCDDPSTDGVGRGPESGLPGSRCSEDSGCSQIQTAESRGLYSGEGSPGGWIVESRGLRG